jgi:2-polyprenyl-6-methoxyphenol hydroxylase-like FAD-dependent oxidoreductase
MTMAARRAVIVGAGIGGLAAGVALQRAGWSVQILERASHVRELGFALLLAPNATAALAQLGLAERVIAAGSEMTAGEVHGMGGRLLRRFDLARIRHMLAQPPVVVLRQALHGALLDAVGAQNVSLNAEAIGCSVHDGSGVVVLANGGSVAGDIVVAADGSASMIRRVLHPHEPPPRASGLWAVRGVAHDVEPHVADLGGAQYFGRGTEGGLARAGRSAVYWYISLPARDLDSRDARSVALRCAGQFDARFRAVVAATRPHDLRLDELFDRDPLPTWGRDRVTLLGDAAHPMLPHAGQGAAQALEDAVALGHALAEAVDVERALRHYEQVRADRTRSIVHLGRRNARLASISNAVVRQLRELAIRAVPASVFTKAYIQFGDAASLKPAPGGVRRG